MTGRPAMGDYDVTLGKALDAAASAHKRIDGLEREVKDLRTLTLAIAKMDSKVDNIREDVEEIKQEVEKVTARPALWWDKLIAAALGALASGIAAAVLAQILR